MQSDLLGELQKLVGDVYAIGRELPRGGMSRVFLAVERSLGRRVVIKVLAPELLSGISEARFQREIRVTANLQHPHILPVLAVGNSDTIRYYVMPFIEGKSLRAKLEQEGTLSVEETVSILQDIADALTHAHERGVIHRDVKPGNILLSDGHAILADFGLASALEPGSNGERLTAAGRAIGTPGYMAPEQLVGDPAVGPRMDLFALGVMGYEMLAGRSPFDDPITGGLGITYFTGPQPLAKARDAVPAEVANAITRAMAPNPAERFATAAEFRDALRPMASPCALPRPIRPSLRKRMTITAFAALALAAIVAAPRASLSARAHPVAEGSTRKLAVLPFKNLGAPQEAYFAEGITEEITSRLANVAGIAVVSRTSADQYRDSRKTLREIARELGVAYILEGSVRWERSPGGLRQVRVTPQLIRVSDDSHLWAERYDEELRGVLTVQTRIAEEVARALAVRMTDE